MSTVLSASVPTRVLVRQYSPAQVLAVWAAAALPMGLLAWIVVPAVAGRHEAGNTFTVALITALTAGLIWQFLLVAVLVAREQGTLRWSVVSRALWLTPPSASPERRGGQLWWWALAATLGVGLFELLPTGVPHVAGRDLGGYLGSPGGREFLHGNWALFALAVVCFVFNTVLGEELLFRGLLLPRMRGVFGRADWIANAALFALYHLHEPWAMPSAFTTGLVMSYSTRRLRSSWMGIISHSAQSVMFTVVLFLLVVG